MSLHIRPARAEDSADLTALARRAKAHWGYPPEWIELWSEDLALTPEYLAANQVFVAESAGVTVGLAALERHDAHWQLEHVWVEPSQHGRGIGRRVVDQALLAAAEEWPADVRVLSDPNAKAFYVRMGAREIGSVAAPMPGAPDRELPMLAFPPGEPNKQLIRAWLAFAAGGFDGDFDDWIAPAYLGHLGTRTMDRAELERLERGFAAAFEDTHHAVHDLLAEGDRVVLRVETSAIHSGDFYGIAPTRRRVSFGGIVIYRIEGRRIAESWAEMDFGAVMQQLRRD